jgi:beta-galactosidase/beta-glucuronidase
LLKNFAALENQGMLIHMIEDDLAGLPVGSRQDGTHPRPQLLRQWWCDLSGLWSFAFDDDDQGVCDGWWRDTQFSGVIRVPFPPESASSGIADTAHHRVSWYQRSFGPAEITAAGHGPARRLMLRFGAVDYRAQVWIDGQLAGSHEGGHTPFSIDITHLLNSGERHELVVRAEDDPNDIAQPRGKQDWQENPHVIWYHRTTGIWQPVWLESVPDISIKSLSWTSDPVEAAARVRLTLSRPPSEAVSVRVSLTFDGRKIAENSTMTDSTDVDVTMSIPALLNGQAYEELLWSPEKPRLIDAVIEVGEDRVASYFGIRTVSVDRGSFLLNDRPYYLRSVLEQGYWPDTHLAAPSSEALREEVQLIKDLGFNAARLHQKFEDPRFLFWADQLGLILWGEAPATFTFTPTAMERTIREWLEVVRRDISHPSIAVWVPLNESWGVQHLARDPRMVHFARSLVDLTKALDPTRPVVSNDGWEQVDTDIVAIHDYEVRPEVIADRYRDRASVGKMIAGHGPAGRRLVLGGDIVDAPIMLTEFGGIAYDVDDADGAWGYTAANSSDHFAEMLTDLFAAVHAADALVGFCYTQLTDTLQETNGLLSSQRRAKIPIQRIRAAVIGTHPDPHR